MDLRDKEVGNGSFRKKKKKSNDVNSNYNMNCNLIKSITFNNFIIR